VDGSHERFTDDSQLFASASLQAQSAQAYGDLLARGNWHQFWTLMFTPYRANGRTGGMHPEAADKAFRYFVHRINTEVYGRRWSKVDHYGLQWARGTEFHKDGRLHFHVVVSAPTNDLNKLMSRYEWHEFWFKEFGRNRLERPTSSADVAHYVSKYVAKGGVVDFSKNFGKWQPPKMDYARRLDSEELLQPLVFNYRGLLDQSGDKKEEKAIAEGVKEWNKTYEGLLSNVFGSAGKFKELLKGN